MVQSLPADQRTFFSSRSSATPRGQRHSRCCPAAKLAERWQITILELAGSRSRRRCRHCNHISIGNQWNNHSTQDPISRHPWLSGMILIRFVLGMFWHPPDGTMEPFFGSIPSTHSLTTFMEPFFDSILTSQQGILYFPPPHS